ncbi:MAG: HutD family protein [Burkholderiales bacterium]|nr:HutD family protein [Burkholderiales bacterium]
MTPRLVALDATPPQPWRNGGGVTRELLAWPEGAGWRVRVSVAEIEADGTFSSFPGVSRWFTVLEGGGVALTIDGAEQIRRAGDPPLAFPGEASVACRLLRGPSRDLNLMLRGAEGAMLPVTPGEGWSPLSRQCGLYALVAGRCVAGGETVDVPAGSLAWFALAPDTLVFRPQGAAPIAPPGWWLAADAREPDA